MAVRRDHVVVPDPKLKGDSYKELKDALEDWLEQKMGREVCEVAGAS